MRDKQQFPTDSIKIITAAPNYQERFSTFIRKKCALSYKDRESETAEFHGHSLSFLACHFFVPGGDFDPSILLSPRPPFLLFLELFIRPRFVARARDARLLVNERVVNYPTKKENV